MMVFTISSLAAGCRHCQAHGAYGVHKFVVPEEKAQAVWSVETSDLFDDRERAARRFGFAAGCVPSAITAERHDDLRAHFSDEKSADWATTVLGPVD